MAANLNRGVLSVAVVVGIALSGCVSSRTHEETLAELEKARHAAVQQAAEDEASLAEARRENERLAARLAEIGQDKLSTKQSRDRLTITMVDRVLFESGSDRITAEGMEVLHKVGAVLREARGKRILVSGHTDNVQIGPSLRGRFKTNWELSTSRATSVVRYLVDHAGIAPQSLTAAGHAYTKPVADNESEKGRSQNRRIEIMLYPKDLVNVVAEDEQ
ncbi:MAG: flagellar motor protein MotB [Nitrospira sp.]|nr:flagellar motor protein MotB [Nitrospira sp.]